MSIKTFLIYLVMGTAIFGESLMNSGTFQGLPIDYKVESYYHKNDPCIKVSIIPNDGNTYYISSSKLPRYPSLAFTLFFKTEESGNAINASGKEWKALIPMVYLRREMAFSKEKPLEVEINLGKIFPDFKPALKNSPIDVFWIYDLEISDNSLFSSRDEKKEVRKLSAPRVGGYLRFPQTSQSARPEKSANAD